MGEREAPEAPGMQALGLSTAAGQPARNGVRAMAEDPAGSGQVSPSASAVSTWLIRAAGVLSR